MSFLSMYGIIVGLIYTIGTYYSIKEVQEKRIKIGAQVIGGLILGFILLSIVLLWKVGLGIYEVKFFY